MRILLSTLHFVEYGLELATALAVENEVHLVLSSQRVEKTFGSGFTPPPNVTCTLLSDDPHKKFRNLLSLIKIQRIIRAFDPQVVHLHEPPIPAFLYQILIHRRPLLMTVHDVQPHPGDLNPRLQTWRTPVLHFLRKRFYPKVHVHGMKLRELFCSIYDRRPDDVFVIPHGSLFSFKSAVEPPPEEPGTVLFFGRVQEYKGLKYLLEAEPLVTPHVPDFKVIVAGSGSDLKNYTEAINKNPQFELHDRFIPNDEVAALFQRSGCVVMPYIEASQSGVLAMAYAFGKPVIATDVGSLPEMVEPGKTGFIIPPRDPKALANALVDLLSDREKRSAMTGHAREAALTRFSWKELGRQTLDAYHATIAANGSRRKR